MRIFFLVGLLLSCYCDVYSSQVPLNAKHVIGEQGGGSGLFSMFFTAIHHLVYCLKNEKTPVLWWVDEYNPYFQKEGFNGAYNVWEYYFEPVSNAKYCEGDHVWHLWSAPDGTGIPIESKSTDVNFRKSIKWVILDRYIKVKPSILEKVEQFYNKHMAGKINVGIHIRGTDKAREVNQVSLNRFIKTAQMINEQNIQFFVATDENIILEKFKKEFSGKVIAYDSFRSINGQAVHVDSLGYSKAKVGEEALIEVLLLAQCHAMIHTLSNFSFAALLFNPELRSILLQ
jgi:hypothetical protein